jgi:membrane associated rhomboid family serine protease
VAEPLRCYRHPERETYVSCSECGRGICPDCMVYGPVGIRCPDHASAGGRAKAPRRAAASTIRRLSWSGPIVTQTLIAINVAVFLIQLFNGADLMRLNTGWIYENGVLVDQAVNSSGQLVGVAEGQWWRLLTATFLHGSLIHLGMNMLVLWLIGPPVEEYFGRARYLLLYLVSGLAGSAGALILSGGRPTVGASGAIFGLMGAALILEWRRIFVFGGQALGLVVVNLALTFAIPGISIGGHIGGLIGGGLCALAFSSFRRSPAVATLAMAAVGVVSVGLAAAQVG